MTRHEYLQRRFAYLSSLQRAHIHRTIAAQAAAHEGSPQITREHVRRAARQLARQYGVSVEVIMDVHHYVTGAHHRQQRQAVTVRPPFRPMMGRTR